MRRTVLVFAVVAVLGGGAGVAGCGSSGTKSAATAVRRPAGGLVGVMFDGPVLGPSVNLDQQLDEAVASGVESLRIAVDWSLFQPYPTEASVPPARRATFEDIDGVPTAFHVLDRVIGDAAARGLSVLPVVEYTPRWAALPPGTPSSPPRSPATYAAFLRALVDRYGPGGTFWRSHPSIRQVPVRMWQIWNEPNFTTYWSAQPFAPSYVRLLSAARQAVKAADPGAKIVLAGFADFSWQYLASVYRVPGARSLFDIVAVHPYTAEPRGVITIIQRVRAVMNKYGDAQKPILATEITWPSSQGKAPPQFGVSVTEAQQAQRLAQLMPLLRANRTKLGLLGFYWYTWMGDETPGAARYGFDYAGLLKYVNGRATAKPALAVFRQDALSLEGCRRKLSAGTCAG